ncbi:MAG: hypothetical protein ACFFFG_06925 [Candidatus Thorarchaeota archaeon]
MVRTEDALEDYEKGKKPGPRSQGVKSIKKTSYWDPPKVNSADVVYPYFVPTSLKSFGVKIASGVIFSFISALVFYMVNVFLNANLDFFRIWGIAMFLVAGIFFIMAGWGDWSRTSARKSYKSFEARKRYTQNPDERFKFDLGLLQFGNMKEDIGAAICLLGIAALMLRLVV